VSREDVRTNLESWESDSDSYQAQHAGQLNRWDAFVWGGWDIPEEDLGALGDFAGLDALELGCGAAAFGIKVAMRDARVVGLDFSRNQLRHAQRNLSETGVRLPLVRASAEELPFAAESFDLVFSDHGATSFTDPHETVAQVARVLRSGGLFVFNMSTPFIWVCWGEDDAPPGRTLRRDYFAMGRVEYDDPDGRSVEWQLTYGEWVRLFRRNGFVIEDLIELRPPEGAMTTYHDAPLEWARAFPGEHIWKVRKG
jgi:SAM-dependent methyltransferase